MQAEVRQDFPLREAWSVEDVDCLGVGFGPANIALAIALEDSDFTGRALFLERMPAPDWQPELLLDGTDIQHNPLRDFVTLRDPTSPYSFLCYLKDQGRLLDFLNLEATFPPRAEYARYVRWVARKFDRWVSYGESAVEIIRDRRPDGRPCVMVRTSLGRCIRASALSFAPGRSAHVPEIFEPALGDRVIHFTRYLTSLARWSSQGGLRSVAVVGASQSAVEIILDLNHRYPALQIHSLCRGFGFQLKDTSPFTEHVYFPEFIDLFYDADDVAKDAIVDELWRSNYSSVDHDILSRLYLTRYTQKLSGRETIHLHSDRAVSSVEAGADGVSLELSGVRCPAAETLKVDAVILATGFRNFGAKANQELFHPLLKDIADGARRRDNGAIHVTRDYRLLAGADSPPLPPVYMNGLCESTHGFGDAGSFSLLSLRSWTIAQSLLAALRSASPARPPGPAFEASPIRLEKMS
ncbi:MAG TPA: SidA/IucD/PvdA family monooxygenase [Allosphingosinicella sp.]